MGDFAPERVAAVRRFNRFYTQFVGALNEGLLASSYSLPQCRVIYEIAQDEGIVAAALARRLSLDPGYLSRLIASLEKSGVVRRSASEGNAKRLALHLTGEGRRVFEGLDQASSQEVSGLLGRLSNEDQRRLQTAMARIEGLLSDRRSGGTFILRAPEPGDMGWIVHRHGALYAQDYGWDWTFEVLVARIVADFIEQFDAARERVWIAERDGEIVGSVFLVEQDEEVAKLRLLYVEPSARGLGLGRRLVEECIRFARAKGYRQIRLWTQSMLLAAGRIYETAGFRLIAEEPHRSFGQDLVGQTWELELR